MRKTAPAEKLMEVINTAVQGMGPKKTTIDGRDVIRDGYWCRIEPARKTWIPVTEADELCESISRSLRQSYPHGRVLSEIVVKRMRGRSGGATIKTPRDLQKWLKDNFSEREETEEDGWTWCIRVRI